MATPTLFGLHFSPWTIRARWALAHHRLPFRYREHVILLGEPLLRRRARRAGAKRASVPLYLHGERALGDSWAIMEFADRHGGGSSLRSEELRPWRDLLEPALQETRVRVTRRTLDDREALEEAAASATPAPLAGLFRPVAARGARFLADKWGFDVQGEDRVGPIEDALTAVREALGDGDYVEGTQLSAADLACATLIQGLRPVERHVQLAPGTRRVWTDDALASEHEDLIAWRDRIFDRHFAAPRLG